MGRKKKAESRPAKDTENVKDAFSVELGIGDLATKLRTESMGVRMSTMSRYRDLVRRKVENIPYDRPEEKKNKEQKLNDQNKYSDEELPKFLARLKQEKRLNPVELTRINTALDMISEIKDLEKRCVTDLIEPYIVKEELYYAYYKHIKGVGPVLAAELINSGMQPAGINKEGKEICPHVSSLRRYCMMDPDGAAGRKSGAKLTGNIQVKTLWWKVAKQMMMAKNEMFTRLYEDAKAKQLKIMEDCKCKNCGERPDEHHKDKKYKDNKYHCKGGKTLFDTTIPESPMSLGHAHMRAQRSALQKFITWHWIIVRQLAGFPTDQGYIFTVAPNPHALSQFINPPYIPDILKDENGNWDSARPAGWIFQVGHKDWKDAPEYVKKLCNVTDAKKPTASLKGDTEAILKKISDATQQGKMPDVTADELANLKEWIYEQEQAKKNAPVTPVQPEVKKHRGRPPKTLAEARENPIEAMKMLRQKETTTLPATPKKRGRPKKTPETKSEIIKKAAEEKGISVTNISVEKKKRGRVRLLFVADLGFQA